MFNVRKTRLKLSYIYTFIRNFDNQIAGKSTN